MAVGLGLLLRHPRSVSFGATALEKEGARFLAGHPGAPSVETGPLTTQRPAWRWGASQKEPLGAGCPGCPDVGPGRDVGSDPEVLGFNPDLAKKPQDRSPTFGLGAFLGG